MCAPFSRLLNDRMWKYNFELDQSPRHGDVNILHGRGRIGTLICHAPYLRYRSSSTYSFLTGDLLVNSFIFIKAAHAQRTVVEPEKVWCCSVHTWQRVHTVKKSLQSVYPVLQSSRQSQSNVWASLQINIYHLKKFLRPRSFMYVPRESLPWDVIKTVECCIVLAWLL